MAHPDHQGGAGAQPAGGVPPGSALGATEALRLGSRSPGHREASPTPGTSLRGERKLPLGERGAGDAVCPSCGSSGRDDSRPGSGSLRSGCRSSAGGCPSVEVRGVGSSGGGSPAASVSDASGPSDPGTGRSGLPRADNRPTRRAPLTVRFTSVRVRPPKHRSPKEGLRSIPLHASFVHEDTPPSGVQPISWMLLTTLLVDTLEDALQSLR